MANIICYYNIHYTPCESLSDTAVVTIKGGRKKRYFRSDPIEMECTSRSDSSQWSCERARTHIIYVRIRISP